MHPFTKPVGTTPKYITTGQLVSDTKLLVPKIPEDVDAIIGIARSGLLVATVLSTLLHKPLYVFRQSYDDVVDLGHGWRIDNSDVKGRVLVVDDSTGSGRSQKQALTSVRKQWPTAVSATVYVNPVARYKPNYFVEELYHPHVFEWNLFNGIFAQDIATDFDGILCEDCLLQEDDDGPKYLNFLETAKPKYLMRRGIVPLIVTARLEKYRDQTERWLRKYGVRHHELVMGPWDNIRERTLVAAFKAKYFAEFLKRPHYVKPPLFIESDANQAQCIARLTGGLVVCPSSKQCFLFGD